MQTEIKKTHENRRDGEAACSRTPHTYIEAEKTYDHIEFLS